MAVLMRRWERARQGDRQLVLIVGEPGLGKSRLELLAAIAEHPVAPDRRVGSAALRRALRRHKRDQEPPSPFLFTSERGAPFMTAGWRNMVVRLGVAAKLRFKAHPHMFRHACGIQLANHGTDTTHSVGVPWPWQHPAHGAPHRPVATRFKNLWRD